MRQRSVSNGKEETEKKETSWERGGGKDRNGIETEETEGEI